jgi:hypothetical protein
MDMSKGQAQLTASGTSQATEDAREAYQAPALKDLGEVSEITQSGGSFPSADFAYS